MKYPQFHYSWQWELESDPETLWPMVSDTDRFDADTGLPPVEDLTEGRLPNAHVKARFHRFGMPMTYEQDPFEWIRPQRFGVARHFSTGPLAELSMHAELTPREGGGTTLTYQSWARPANPLGLLAIPLQIGWMAKRDFGRVFKEYDQLAQRGRGFIDLPAEKVTFAAGGRARLRSLRDELKRQADRADLADRLVELVETGTDLSLSRLRPYALADQWGAPRRTVLELCLLATRIGILEFQWDLLCPKCRDSKASYTTLGLVDPSVHCETCNIDFSANFSQSVEITFRPSPSIRTVRDSVFCINAPQATPHVAVQQLLQPGESRTAAPSLEAGRYRLRALEMPGGQSLRVADEGETSLRINVDTDGWPDRERRLSRQPEITVANTTDREQLVILERMAWTDQAATAADVTTLQRFRDLFSEEALRPGERVSVGSLTVLFTDLRSSTRLYRDIGDAPAFGVVMNHFDVLKEAVAANDGAIVKNIGDAIMAVFTRPVSALRAASDAQWRLANPGDGGRPLVLKAGIHAGPCIAVTLSERLDYFGSTVNIAARLEAMSSGTDVVVSDSVYRDSEVAALLANPEAKLFAESTAAALKGFDDAEFELWLVKRRER